MPRHVNLVTPPATPVWDMTPGDGFLMRHGWTVGWCGWQWGVYRSDALMGIEAPQALGTDGKPIVGKVAVEFRPNAPESGQLLADVSTGRFRPPIRTPRTRCRLPASGRSDAAAPAPSPSQR